MSDTPPSGRADVRVQELLRERIVAERVAQGLSRTALAEKAGLTQWMITLIEEGERNLSLESALRVCHALGLQLWELLKEVEEEL